MKLVSPRKLVNDAMDDCGLSGQANFTRFYRWYRDSMVDLGPQQCYAMKSERVEVDANCNHIEIPSNVLHLRRVFLCDGYGITEAGYGGKGTAQIWDPRAACAYYNNGMAYMGGQNDRLIGGGGYPSPSFGNSLAFLPTLHQDYEVVLGEQVGDPSVLFFMAGDPSAYKYAVIEYLGFQTDDQGLILAPQPFSLAAKAYMCKMFNQRARQRNRDIPLAEMQEWSRIYDKEYAIAYTKIKTPTKIEMDEWVLQNWGRRLPVPYSRMTRRSIGSNRTPSTTSIPATTIAGFETLTGIVPPIAVDPSVDPCLVGAPDCGGISIMEINTTFIVNCGTPVPDTTTPGGQALTNCVSYENLIYRYVSCLINPPGNDTTQWAVNRYLKSDGSLTAATTVNNPTQFTKPTDLQTVQSLNYQ